MILKVMDPAFEQVSNATNLFHSVLPVDMLLVDTR